MKCIFWSVAYATLLRGRKDDRDRARGSPPASHIENEHVSRRAERRGVWLQDNNKERAKRNREEYIPGYEVSKYGGQIFHDSVWATNIWDQQRRYPFIDDLAPTAPMDRLDGGPIPSIDSAPEAPGGDEGNRPEWGLYGDFAPPLLHPNAFPSEQQNTCVDTRAKRLSDRHLIAKPDVLRPHRSFVHDVRKNYPIQAPEDRLARGIFGWKTDPVPVSAHDWVPDEYARYFEQMYQKEQEHLAEKKTYDAYKAADTSDDNSIDWNEFTQEVEKRQHKSGEDAQKLWNAYKMPDSEVMTSTEYMKVVKDGFDLGTVKTAQKLRATLDVSCALNAGFWAGAAMCPGFTKAVGARLKVQAEVQDGDNTGLNGVELRCRNLKDNSEETDIKSMEGKNGSYGEWGLCPEGTHIGGFRSRTQVFDPSGDNAGVTDFAFLCNDKSGAKKMMIKFGGEKLKKEESKGITGGWVKVVAGERADYGGWATDAYCPRGSAICGHQPRLDIGQPEGKNIGIANERFFLLRR